MNNWIPKNKSLRFAVSLALLSIVLYLVGLMIVVRETKKVESFYHDAESEFSKNARLLAVKSITESNKDLISILRQFFIKKGDEVKFIEQIEGVARESSIEFNIVAIDVKSNKDTPFKEDISVKVEVLGSWKNLMNFVGQLEKMPFGVLVQSTNLKTDGLGAWSGFIEFIVFREI